MKSLLGKKVGKLGLPKKVNLSVNFSKLNTFNILIIL